MTEGRKRAISMRVSVADLRKIKCIAQRLSVRESDVLRFAIKTTLTRLSLLSDPAIRGRSLLPLFIDPTKELAAHFDLDAPKLDELINGGVDEASRRVPLDDLHGIAMNGVPSLSPAFLPQPPVVQPTRGFQTITHASKSDRHATPNLSRHATLADTESSA